MRRARSGARKIVVAMSGGVDSSAAAALLLREGHHVIGVTLRLYSDQRRHSSGRSCCAGQDIRDARRVAETLGIAHYVLDYEARFRERVIADFADSYRRGETPIPCVQCNSKIKFADLMDFARDMGADALATGHYVRRAQGVEGPELHMASDPGRDQSYFLFATTSEQLDFLLFPLGEMAKTKVRDFAASQSLPVAGKPDSQDICFVPDGDYAGIVGAIHPDARKEGPIATRDGEIVGRHRGVIHFTVGQRKGLGLSGQSQPMYVLGVDADKNLVRVGPRSDLAVRSFSLRGVNWLSPGEAPVDCQVKVRSTRAPVAARVVPLPDDRAEVALDSAEEGVAPGQACVFYRGTRVLGGGFIARPA
ncbi:MAG: tRNA 2-thiouridine(34) synthase MnmA [Alphaproteobacteria bacterium]|nr:tRNA 2-thiouridine(34) synthase MnmA [Alphaproteobacteria bacterium]